MIILGVTDPAGTTTRPRSSSTGTRRDGRGGASHRIKHASQMPPTQGDRVVPHGPAARLGDVDVFAIGFIATPEDAHRRRSRPQRAGSSTAADVARRFRDEYRDYRKHKFFLAQLDAALGLSYVSTIVSAASKVAGSCGTTSPTPPPPSSSRRSRRRTSSPSTAAAGRTPGSSAIGRGTEIEVVRVRRPGDELGQFYERFTGALGFKAHSDEGKVMGLAAYGDHGTRSSLRPTSNGDGDPPLRPGGFLQALKEIRAAPEERSHPINGYHEHVAARLQYTLEQVDGAHGGGAPRAHRPTDLCMAGGTALNCSCNGKLLSLPHVKRIFVQPAAADCGTALGAAVYAHVKLTGKRPKTRFNHVYWGPGFSNDEIEPVLKQAKVPYRKVERRSARRPRSSSPTNKIVGWFQGRMEVGPRALGGRSIVANPDGRRA